METKLDREKLEKLLRMNGKGFPWLTRQLGWSRQQMYYHKQNKTIKLADMAAPFFGLRGKDLIK